MIIYLIVVVGIGLGPAIFSKKAFKALPEIAERTIPAVVLTGVV